LIRADPRSSALTLVPSSFDRARTAPLGRLVVHVDEAVRLGTMADESHRRLGLMLLDSAAEVMMDRECRLRA
jgi:hypothetical protein